MPWERYRQCKGLSSSGSSSASATLPRAQTSAAPPRRWVLQRFAFFVATPCLMFTLISKENLADVFTSSMAVAFGSAVITGAAFMLLARFVFRLDLADSTVGTLVSMYMNANNIGLPVATYILGDPAAVTPIVLMQQVVFTPLALTALDISTTGKSSFAATAKQLAHQPILIGVLCGIIVSAASAGTGVFLVPQFLYDPLNIVGQAAVPLILCAFGMSLRGARPLASREGHQATITAAALKNVLMPAGRLPWPAPWDSPATTCTRASCWPRCPPRKTSSTTPRATTPAPRSPATAYCYSPSARQCASSRSPCC